MKTSSSENIDEHKLVKISSSKNFMLYSNFTYIKDTPQFISDYP